MHADERDEEILRFREREREKSVFIAALTGKFSLPAGLDLKCLRTAATEWWKITNK